MLTILDGGMGQELVERAGRPPTSLWSADVMDLDPELVIDVHRDFIDAGASIITVNAYSATRCRLAPHGREGDYERLQRLAVELAHEACHERTVMAGCLSPYAWSYRPELAPEFDQLWEGFAETAELQAHGVNLFLCETMGSAREAAAAAVGAATTGKPVWVSWSLHDDASGRLRSGETIREAVDELERREVEPSALLINCSTPEAITAALPELLAAGQRVGVPVGAYGNGFGAVDPNYGPGSTVDELTQRDDLDPDGYCSWTQRWVDAGITLIGGCCDIGPDHIRRLAQRFG